MHSRLFQPVKEDPAISYEFHDADTHSHITKFATIKSSIRENVRTCFANPHVTSTL